VQQLSNAFGAQLTPRTLTSLGFNKDEGVDDQLLIYLKSHLKDMLAASGDDVRQFMFTYLVEPTRETIDAEIQSAQDSHTLGAELLTEYLSAGSNRRVYTREFVDPSPKSLKSILGKLAKKSFQKRYQEFVDFLNQSIELGNGESVTVLEALHIIYHSQCTEIDNPVYHNMIPDGGRGTIISRSPQGLHMLDHPLKGREECAIDPIIAEIFPDGVIKGNTYFEGIEAKKGGLVYAKSMIGVRSYDSKGRPVIGVFECQTMSGPMIAAKKIEDEIYHTFGRIEGECDFAKKAGEFFLDLGRQYYLAAVMMDSVSSYGNEWTAIYDKALNSKGIFVWWGFGAELCRDNEGKARLITLPANCYGNNKKEIATAEQVLSQMRACVEDNQMPDDNILLQLATPNMLATLAAFKETPEKFFQLKFPPLTEKIMEFLEQELGISSSRNIDTNIRLKMITNTAIKSPNLKVQDVEYINKLVGAISQSLSESLHNHPTQTARA
jgi:hypothetical protein